MYAQSMVGLKKKKKTNTNQKKHKHQKIHKQQHENRVGVIKVFRTVQDLFLENSLKRHESNQEIWMTENPLGSSIGIHTFPFQASVVTISVYKGNAKGGG